jgi:hypothetical protein
MTTLQITYQQLDQLLLNLGFSRERVEPKWLRYTEASSDTEIILVEKKPTDPVRATDAWSVREHLVRKGLISEEDLDAFLQNGFPSALEKSSKGNAE